MKVNRSRQLHRGIALIFVAGILTILVATGTAFFLLTQASVSSSVRYSDMVRADLLARAGLNDAIARLREQAFKKTEDPGDPWYTTDWLNGRTARISFAETFAGNTQPYTRALGSTVSEEGDRYTLEITDAASRINVNAGDNLAVILDNLCRLIGPPLVPADQDALQPRRWAVEGASPGLYDTALNDADTESQLDLCYRVDTAGRPVRKGDGTALYGDGYAIAGYRSRHGVFGTIDELRNALTYVERNGNTVRDDPLEVLEVEAKFAALKEYLTTAAWVDTTTVGVGKFEWASIQHLSNLCYERPLGVYGMQSAGTDTDPATGQSVNVWNFQGLATDDNDYQVLIDRDKSWIADDPINDPLNERGSLRGAYVSIMNGHGAGQLRRIATNGTDWIAIHAYDPDESMKVPPGPISSYLIMGREDALVSLVTGTTGTYLPRVRLDGSMPDDPAVDYEHHPLCIHRAPVNINTASDKVLAALLMSLNIQHGHPLSVGTVVRDGLTLADGIDKSKLVPSLLKDPPLPFSATDWKTKDYVRPKYTVNANQSLATARELEPYLLTMKGVKRIPADTGKLVFNRPRPYEAVSPQFDYIAPPLGPDAWNEAQELALRIILARQETDWAGNPLGTDPVTGFARGPFRSWDDLYFRVVRPWDEQRVNEGRNGNEYHIVGRARLIMANANNNTDILKFNPNIEWIDRWGRNFTEMEPVMIFADAPGTNEPLWIPYLPWPRVNASDGYYCIRPVEFFNCQPGSYYTRSLRYKSDDLIDKTDLNRSTSEFSFDSGGVYTVTSTGQVIGPIGLLAERKIESLVKVYDVWRESTQDQFVRGYISVAKDNNGLDPVTNANRSGRIVRDARNVSAPFKRLALDTLPEPLVPLAYRIDYPTGTGTGLKDLTSVKHYDAWRNDKGGTSPYPVGTPDIVANGVLPARYDGQIVLASNTQAYDTGAHDSFLASFNGDLDTDTCGGNGRESAKTPCDYKVRVVDTIGLLGLLNDTEVDFDPKEKRSDAPTLPDYELFAARSANKAMRALRPQNYWENVTCRMGDLRPDGVNLGNVGISGKDATLKYQQEGNWDLGKVGAKGSTQVQMLVRLWFKPSWHQNDMQDHEFFNATTVEDGQGAHAMLLGKWGKFTNFRRADVGATFGGKRMDCMWFHHHDKEGKYNKSVIHGGHSMVPADTRYPEAPCYRSQPFRWHFIGGALNMASELSSFDGHFGGLWFSSATNPEHTQSCTRRTRVFMNSMLVDVTQPDDWWDPKSMWSEVSLATSLPDDHFDASGNAGATPQIASWPWASAADAALAKTPIFSVDNLNKSTLAWIFRASPIDGTQAVVDEYKISLTEMPDTSMAYKIWYDNRIPKEMTTSRYYLPWNPANRDACPTFTSQTILQSLRGTADPSNETISVVRVSWNGFTPRFMHENKQIQTQRTRREAHGDAPLGNNALKDVNYRGPFDYIQYNWEILPVNPLKAPGKQCEREWNAKLEHPAGSNVFPLGCERPTLRDYQSAGLPQSHASMGLEVELLRDPDGSPDSGDEVILNPDGKPFTNPDTLNALGEAILPVRVRTNELRYRIRFRYPVDYFVRNVYGDTETTIDQAKHYLLDTPVFDDISVTYFGRSRILAYRELTE